MDAFQKIERWNEERGLIARGFDHTKEVSFIIEELLESTGQYNSETARARAEEVAASIVADTAPNAEQIVDSFADIIVFATGAIAKCGYDPSAVMEEVYQEINSRTGRLVDGKFVKDPSAVPYKANLAACRKTTKNTT
jgi:predicted HAD superfamily Cof-like phosphohydrolase